MWLEHVSRDEKQVGFWVHAILLLGLIREIGSISLWPRVLTNKIWLILLFSKFTNHDHMIIFAIFTPKLTRQILLEVILLLNICHLFHDVPMGSFTSQNYWEALAYVVLIKVLFAEVYVVVVDFCDLVIGVDV